MTTVQNVRFNAQVSANTDEVAKDNPKKNESIFKDVGTKGKMDEKDIDNYLKGKDDSLKNAAKKICEMFLGRDFETVKQIVSRTVNNLIARYERGEEINPDNMSEDEKTKIMFGDSATIVDPDEFIVKEQKVIKGIPIITAEDAKGYQD